MLYGHARTGSRFAVPRKCARAVENAFSVKVKKVNTISMPGKEKRYGVNLVPKKPWKKAIILLQPGQSIEIFEGV